MFHAIPPAMAQRMRELEAIDAADRDANLPRLERLRQVPPETGKFIALLAASAPAGAWIEIGTSAGYSTLWLSLACRARGCKMQTYELLPKKIALAQETFRAAGVEDVIELIPGDARQFLPTLQNIAFCFLDAEKDVYAECYELIVPRMIRGGLLVADNALNHRKDLQPMIDRALTDERVDAMVVPIENGEVVCRKL